MHRPLILGFCFLCRTDGLMVVWIGPVETDGMQAPVYACEPCCEFARQYIERHQRAYDMRPAS